MKVEGGLAVDTATRVNVKVHVLIQLFFEQSMTIAIAQANPKVIKSIGMLSAVVLIDHRTTKCNRRREDVVLTIQHSLIHPRY